jgi:hypothetical protein
VKFYPTTTKKLNNYFETIVEISVMKIGKRQTVETLINEEAFLLAKFLRGMIDSRESPDFHSFKTGAS